MVKYQDDLWQNNPNTKTAYICCNLKTFNLFAAHSAFFRDLSPLAISHRTGTRLQGRLSVTSSLRLAAAPEASVLRALQHSSCLSLIKILHSFWPPWISHLYDAALQQTAPCIDIPHQNHGSVVCCCRHCCKIAHPYNLGGKVYRKVIWGENVRDTSLWLLLLLLYIIITQRKKKV